MPGFLVRIVSGATADSTGTLIFKQAHLMFDIWPSHHRINHGCLYPLQSVTLGTSPMRPTSKIKYGLAKAPVHFKVY